MYIRNVLEDEISVKLIALKIPVNSVVFVNKSEYNRIYLMASHEHPAKTQVSRSAVLSESMLYGCRSFVSLAIN